MNETSVCVNCKLPISTDELGWWKHVSEFDHGYYGCGYATGTEGLYHLGVAASPTPLGPDQLPNVLMELNEIDEMLGR